MKTTFTKIAWEDYLSWQNEDKKMLKKINALIEEIIRTPFEGRGKPEPLKYDLTGYWSRRIDQEHRLVYQFKQGEVLIYSCRFHYDD
jgi:toxin YoeB